MPTNKKLTLITRPQEEAEPFAAMLDAKGLPSFIEPMLSIQYHDRQRNAVANALKQKYDCIAITSLQSLKALANWKLVPSIPLIATGDATTDLARRNGIRDVRMASGGGVAVSDYIVRHWRNNARVLYLSGEDTRIDLAARLAARGLHCDRLAVYKAEAADGLSETLIGHIKNGAIRTVTLFSVRTAEVYQQLAAPLAPSPAIAVCFSRDVADACRLMPWEKIIIADLQTQESMADAVQKVFQ